MSFYKMDGSGRWFQLGREISVFKWEISNEISLMQSYLIAKTVQSPLNTARITKGAWPPFTAQIYFPINGIKVFYPFFLSSSGGMFLALVIVRITRFFRHCLSLPLIFMCLSQTPNLSQNNGQWNLSSHMSFTHPCFGQWQVLVMGRKATLVQLPGLVINFPFSSKAVRAKFTFIYRNSTPNTNKTDEKLDSQFLSSTEKHRSHSTHGCDNKTRQQRTFYLLSDAFSVLHSAMN